LRVPSSRIALIGLPGSGKSSVGRQLARRIGASFADTDAVIEKKLGESIRSFFDREGEAPFRDLEATVVASLSQDVSVGVLATGGGCVLRESNRSTLRSAFTVVYLRASPEELYRRLARDTQRPLLQVREPRAALRDLLEKRDPLYRELADFVIDTGRPTVHALVGMVLMQLELAGCIDASSVPSVVDGGAPVLRPSSP
jgi:shikimate kinase